MVENKLRGPLRFITAIYLLCFIFRGIEYLVIRTDQSSFGEAVLHKLVGILILALVMRYLSLKWRDIGFTRHTAVKNTFYGLLLGITAFAIAYGVEFFMQQIAGNNPSLQTYVTSYSIDGNLGKQTALMFFAFCIVGNIINVTMEEGIFRGLFIRLAETKYSFLKSVVFSSVLFGIWHIAAPVRSLIDGERSAAGTVMFALMLIFTTGITGFKFGLLTKITGSVWMPMADHFLNNTIINMLHVVTTSGADEMQMIRISIAQTVSFIIVLFVYWKSGAHRKQTFRTEL